jgi:hypothetical protein
MLYARVGSYGPNKTDPERFWAQELPWRRNDRVKWQASSYFLHGREISNAGAVGLGVF